MGLTVVCLVSSVILHGWAGDSIHACCFDTFKRMHPTCSAESDGHVMTRVCSGTSVLQVG
eukprot:1160136-Pelagomonas_calceolata.AAC.17